MTSPQIKPGTRCECREEHDGHGWRHSIPADRCQGCQWSRDVMPFDDADGRRFWLCDDCRPAAHAEKLQTLADRKRAAEAREREAEGQLRLDGMVAAHVAPKPPLSLF